MRIVCTAKDSHIFSTKNNKHICDIYFQNFNEMLTNDVVNFEHPSPGCFKPVCTPNSQISLQI